MSAFMQAQPWRPEPAAAEEPPRTPVAAAVRLLATIADDPGMAGRYRVAARRELARLRLTTA